MRSHACKPRRVSRPARACLILGGGQLEVLDARLCHPASKVQAVCLARYGGRRRGLQGIGDGPRRRAVGSGDGAAVGPSTAQGAHWPIAAPQPSRPNLEHLIPLGLLVRQADEATPLRRGVFGQAPQSASGAGAQVGVAAPRARLELSHLVTAPIPTHTHTNTHVHTPLMQLAWALGLFMQPGGDGGCACRGRPPQPASPPRSGTGRTPCHHTSPPPASRHPASPRC